MNVTVTLTKHDLPEAGDSPLSGGEEESKDGHDNLFDQPQCFSSLDKTFNLGKVTTFMTCQLAEL